MMILREDEIQFDDSLRFQPYLHQTDETIQFYNNNHNQTKDVLIILLIVFR
jgi:hypothetical protein